MSVEAIARMGGKGLSLDYIPGGIPSLTMDEIMGCLAGLDRGPELLIRAVVVGQPVMDELYREGFHLAVRMATDRGWRPVKGKPVLRNMAAMAIEELVAPGLHRCNSCRGTGRRVTGPDKPVEECSRCGGTGNRPISKRSRAARCELDEASWRRVWEPRFQHVREAVFDWWEHGCRHVRRQIRSDQ